MGADMTAVGELVLVLGLLVSARCEVRARDPEVEEEEEELGGRTAGGGGGGAAFPSYLKRLFSGTTETPPQGEGGNYPARTGNWCAFVHKRVVTVAMACGTEKYTIRSQSLCPSGTPNCQLVMYKLSTRPVYRQKQQVFTALLWRCCPGHGGQNCEDTVSDAQLDSGNSARTELHPPDIQLPSGDPNREQNDHQGSITTLHDTGYPDKQHNTTTHHALDPDHAHKRGHTHKPDPALDPNHTHKLDQTHDPSGHGHRPGHAQKPHAANTYDPHRQQEHHLPVVDELDATVLVYPEPPATLPYTEAPAALPVPDMMALVLSQLQPVLEGFNRSLEHLSRQVGVLARDVAQLKSSQLRGEPQVMPPDHPELDEAAEKRLDGKLDEISRQMENQRADMENRLHSQHAMLHYNFTSFKMDVDMKLKRHQKMLQVSLQAVNTTLAELKLDQDHDQDQDTQDQLEDHLPPPSLPPPHPPQPSDTSALWEAIERLDDTVVNNTVKVGGLMEDMEVTAGNVQQLRRDLKELGKQINQTARNSQILFMETGLEVEAAKEAVLRRVGELAGNLSQQGERVEEMDVDVDYLYTTIYKHNSSGNCDCKGLKAAVARLEGGVANVTELANENRLALDENSEGGAGQWGGASDWELAVGTLQNRFQQVEKSLASEHNRTRTLDHSLTQLNSSVTAGLAEISGLRAADGKLLEEMEDLSGSFKSLLKDVSRNSDVLEMLLGEEVLEFVEWPVQDQEAHSISALQEQLRNLQEQLKNLQEQLRGHNLSIPSLLGHKPGARVEALSADQPATSSHPQHDSTRRSGGGAPARERQLLLRPLGRRPEHGGDGSDLWNLEKTVEGLGLKVLRLEEKCCNTSKRQAPPGGAEAELRAEVTWLKRGLEEHLRVFKNVFSNADVLAGSDATLELDKLWLLVKNKDGKKEKKRGGGREGTGRGGNHRSRRDSSGVVPVPFSQSEDSLLVVAGSPLSASNGVLVLEASLNRGQFYSDTGTFTAPANGIYLFVLTLDLRPGPAHVVLSRGSGAAPAPLHRQEVTEAGPVTRGSLLLLREGEEVRLELKGGAWAESADNVFTVLLLHRTT